MLCSIVQTVCDSKTYKQTLQELHINPFNVLLCLAPSGKDGGRKEREYRVYKGTEKERERGVHIYIIIYQQKDRHADMED